MLKDNVHILRSWLLYVRAKSASQEWICLDNVAHFYTDKSSQSERERERRNPYNLTQSQYSDPWPRSRPNTDPIMSSAWLGSRLVVKGVGLEMEKNPKNKGKKQESKLNPEDNVDKKIMETLETAESYLTLPGFRGNLT